MRTEHNDDEICSEERMNYGDHLFQWVVTFTSGHMKLNQFDSSTHQILGFQLILHLICVYFLGTAS